MKTCHIFYNDSYLQQTNYLKYNSYKVEPFKFLKLSLSYIKEKICIINAQAAEVFNSGLTRFIIQR